MGRKNILFCSSEVAPFSKTGGLADVAGALPKYVAKHENVTIITPLYNDSILKDYEAKHIGKKSFGMGDEKVTVNYHSFLRDGVNYVFVEHDSFKRDSLYGYLDDNRRFFIFDYAILEYIGLANLKVDLLHLNDWQTGMVPFLLNNHYRKQPLYKDIKTLITIHNLQFHGSFDKSTYKYTNLDFSYDYIHFDNFNFLKAGILLSDAINTVSETYKDEIQTEHYGYMLDGLLKDRSADLYGIVNGIDYDIYNPETDPNIDFNYNKSKFVTGKRNNKALFLKTHGLDQVTSIPLVAFVSRLAKQKGIDLMLATLEEVIAQSNANFAILGSGDEVYENFFSYLAAKYPNRVYAYIGFSHKLAQKLYASSDIFMMPSEFEPCGLSQMIAMRYGSLPVVRETGGLKDTVIPYNKYTNEGDGFSFRNYNAHEFKNTLLSAIDLYNNNQTAFRTIQQHAMEKNFSLEVMGDKYLSLYKKTLQKNRR
jgi:starch synthase